MDIWAVTRAEQGINAAERLLYYGEKDQALQKIESVVTLLEDAMTITDEIILPTSCRFLDGMEWRAKEEWFNYDNDPDGREERIVSIETCMSGLTRCNLVFPSRFYDALQGAEFASLRNDPVYEELCQRVKSLIITRPKENS